MEQNEGKVGFETGEALVDTVKWDCIAELLDDMNRITDKTNPGILSDAKIAVLEKAGFIARQADGSFEYAFAPSFSMSGVIVNYVVSASNTTLWRMTKG